jgi:hypothetical protein
MTTPHHSLDRHISSGGRVTLAGPGRATAMPIKPRYPRVEIGGFRRPITVTLMVILFGVGVGDFVNAKTVFDLVFTESASVYAWALAISLTALAIIVTHAAGYLCREAQHHRGLKGLSALMLAAWLAAGGLLAALRVVIGSTTGTATSGQADNPLAGLQNTGGSAPHPLVVALVLAAVWLATGLVSFATGYLAHAPADAALGRLEASTARESQRLGKARRDECQAAHAMAAQRLHKTRLREACRQADARAAGHRDELRAWARSELVRVLGDPAATNDILPRPASTDKE